MESPNREVMMDGTRESQIASLCALRVERESVDARALVALSVLCDSYATVPAAPEGFLLAGECLIRPGADGTPAVAETLELEVGIALRISPEAARAEIAAVLNLRHRHRLLWDLVITGDVLAWVAKRVAMTCAPLSAEQAAAFDAEWSQRMAYWSAKQTLTHVERRVPHLLGTSAEEMRQQALNRRRVDISASAPGVARVEATMDAGAAHQLDATLDQVAEVLRRGGAGEAREQLRADALGHLAHPDRARRLLSPSLLDGAAVLPGGEVVDTDGEIVTPEAERCRHGAEVIIHLDSRDLAVGRGGDSPDLGPVLRAQLGELMHQCGGRVLLRPVIDLRAPAVVNTYRPSEDLARRVQLRDRRVLFPYSNRSARGRGVDLDHTIAYPEGKTELINLAPLTRRAHRARTHFGFGVDQPSSGVLHWRTPAGQQAWVSRDGVWTNGPPDILLHDPGVVDARLAEILARNQELAQRWVADSAAREDKERVRRRQARAHPPPTMMPSGSPPSDPLESDPWGIGDQSAPF